MEKHHHLINKLSAIVTLIPTLMQKEQSSPIQSNDITLQNISVLTENDGNKFNECVIITENPKFSEDVLTDTKLNIYTHDIEKIEETPSYSIEVKEFTANTKPQEYSVVKDIGK